MDLSTDYLGMRLPHPFVPGAGPLADTLDGARRLEDAGAPLIVLRSLFEEQLASEALATHQALEWHAECFAEAIDYLPDPPHFAIGPDAYLAHIRRLKESLGIPVVASLNAAQPGSWESFARQIEQAGADALELNFYLVPTDPRASGAQIEEELVQIVAHVRRSVRIPLAVKLSPFHTSLPHLAARLEQAGANGLVLFNRFFEPHLDLELLEVVPRLVLSTPAELPLRLRWLAILSPLVRGSLAVSGGVHSVTDAVRAVLCGAHAVQVVSALLRHGPQWLRHLRHGLRDWMEQNDYPSLRAMRGAMNLARCPDPAQYGRANYIRQLQTFCAPPG